MTGHESTLRIVRGTRLAGPELGTVEDTKNLDGISGEAIDDDVWQSRHDHFPRPGVRALMPKVRESGERPSGLANSMTDSKRGCRAFLVDVLSNPVKLARGARREAQLHRPNFRQTASTSSSVANSPRSASSKACLTSSTCSGVRPYSAGRDLANSSNSSPATSCWSGGSFETASIPRSKSFVITNPAFCLRPNIGHGPSPGNACFEPLAP